MAMRFIISALLSVAVAVSGTGTSIDGSCAGRSAVQQGKAASLDEEGAALLQVRAKFAESPSQRPKARSLVVTEMANTPHHKNQFEAVFFPSWQMISEDPNAGPYVVDLMAFCEVGLAAKSVNGFEDAAAGAGACALVPSVCTELKVGDSPSSVGPARCYFQALAADYVTSIPYSFGLSLEFMTSDAFAKAASSYDYVMRSDADAVLMPGLRSWVPEYGSAVGQGFAGTDFTYKRLEEVAKRRGLKHHGVHGMQSTFFISSKKIVPFARLLVDLSNHFYEEEFTPAICEEVHRLGGKCSWADWYHMVSSLYATDLAANNLLGEPDFNVSQVSDKLDHCATSCFSQEYHDNGDLAASTKKASEVAQVHLLSAKNHLGRRFLVAGSLEEFCQRASETWPGLQVPHGDDWGGKEESVNTFFMRVLDRSLPRMCPGDVA